MGARAWFVVLGILTAGPAHALSLQESMARALEENPTFAATRTRAEATRAAIGAAIAPGLPQLALGASARSLEIDDRAVLRSGGRERDEWGASASVSQVLYASGRIRNDVASAKSRAEDASWRVEEARQRLLLSVAEAYADVLRSRAVLDAQLRSIETLEAQRAYVEANRVKGFLTATDLAQSDARLAQARASAGRARADVIATEEAFRRIVGESPDMLAQPPSAAGLPSTLQDALAGAEDRRALVRSAQAAVRAAAAAARAAAAEGRPRITAEAITEKFGDARDPKVKQGQEDSASLRVSVPIFSGGGPWARARQQRLERDAAELDLEAARRQVREQVAAAWGRLEAARVALAAARAQVEAAELALRGMRREQENGLRAVVDVLDQERDLLTARIALAVAQRDVTVTEREVLFAIGALTLQAGAPAV